MSSAQFNAGESHGQAQILPLQDRETVSERPSSQKYQANTEQWIDSAKSVANSAVDKGENAVQRASESGQQNNDHNTGFLQQKGEQMIHMAQGAIGGVKNTFGMGSDKK